MLFKLTDPLKPLAKMLETLRKAIEKKLTAQTVNHLAVVLVLTTAIISAQLFVALVIMRVLGI